MPTPEEIADFNQKFNTHIDGIISLLYHAACPFSYSGKTDVHPKELLEANGRSVLIDLDLVPLIQELWRLGFHTVGSCQEVVKDTAYIQFLSEQHGGTGFVRILQQLSILHSLSVEPSRLTIKAGSTIGDLIFNSVNIRFPRNRINDIAAAIKLLNDKNV